jgi:hypothetical protein
VSDAMKVYGLDVLDLVSWILDLICMFVWPWDWKFQLWDHCVLFFPWMFDEV